jgi:hypothetical protein
VKRPPAAHSGGESRGGHGDRGGAGDDASGRHGGAPCLMDVRVDDRHLPAARLQPGYIPATCGCSRRVSVTRRLSERRLSERARTLRPICRRGGNSPGRTAVLPHAGVLLPLGWTPLAGPLFTTGPSGVNDACSMQSIRATLLAAQQSSHRPRGDRTTRPRPSSGITPLHTPHVSCSPRVGASDCDVGVPSAGAATRSRATWSSR